jgi:RNA polymerase sigma-70 factor (ECF subfamily)
MFFSALSPDLGRAAWGGRHDARTFPLFLLGAAGPRGRLFSTEMSRAGQAHRIRALVDAHFAFVWRYLRGLGVPASEVDDAAQQVFVIAAQKIDAIHEGAERSFLVGTAHGVAANARRAGVRRREVSGDEVLEGFVDDAPDAEARAGTRQELEVLDGFLSSLPEELREVFILFELEGVTMAAIAVDLGLAPGTVASRLRRAREAFQDMAKRYQASRPSRGPLS